MKNDLLGCYVLPTTDADEPLAVVLPDGVIIITTTGSEEGDRAAVEEIKAHLADRQDSHLTRL